MTFLEGLEVAAHTLSKGQHISIKAYNMTLATHQLLINTESQTLAKSMRELAVFSTAFMIAIIPLSVISALFFYREFETVEKVLFVLTSIALLYTWICIDAGKVRAACEILESRGGDNEQN